MSKIYCWLLDHLTQRLAVVLGVLLWAAMFVLPFIFYAVFPKLVAYYVTMVSLIGCFYIGFICLYGALTNSFDE